VKLSNRRHDEDRTMRAAPKLAAAALALLGLTACTPTVRVEVAPINIYAKLDANVRLQLDEDVKALIQKNPNLF
jgi:hypothetical protein